MSTKVQPDRRRHLLQDVGIQAVGNYVSTFARVVRGFVIAGILGPVEMGVVSTGNLLLNYAQYADLGIAQGLNREIPMDLGRGEDDRAAEWVWYGLLGKLIAGLLVLAGAVAWAVSPLGSGQPEAVRLVIVIAAATSLVAGILLVFQFTAKSYTDFNGAARMVVLLAFANLVAGIVGARLAGAVGVALGVLAASAIAAVYGWHRVRPVHIPVMTRRRLLELIRIGMPLALLTFMGFNLENIDQVIILSLLDRESLGLYAIVLQAGGLLTLTALSVSNVVGPRLVRRYAESGSLEAIADLTWKPALALSALLPLVVCVSWVVGPLAIQWLLPEYISSVGPFKVYMTAMFFLGLNLGVSSTLLALGRHRLNVPIMLGCIVFNVAVDIVLVGWAGLGLQGVALGSLATYFVYWLLHTGLVRWYFERDLARVVRANLRIVWPGLVLVAMLGLSAIWGRVGTVSPGTDALFVIVAAVVAWLQGRRLLPEIGELFGGQK